MTSLTTIDELWADCEYAGRLSPHLVDYTIDVLGDVTLGEFLHWCYRADRWPVGGTAIQFRWGQIMFPSIDPRCRPLVKFNRADLPNMFWGKCKRGPHDNRVLHYVLFPAARAAFEFLYAAWQKLTEAERRQLWEAC